MEFTGCFNGGSNAQIGSNEETVSVSDGFTDWIGQKFGFVRTLNDNALKPYLQGRYMPTLFGLISINDNEYQTYWALVNTSNHKQVVFFIDGVINYL